MAGRVKITPAARLSPLEAAVCTMLFSRMFELRNIRKMAIEMTAAGMDAETVMPANRPRYAFAPPSSAESTMPSTIALMVTSGSVTCDGMYGSWRGFKLSRRGPAGRLAQLPQRVRRVLRFLRMVAATRPRVGTVRRSVVLSSFRRSLSVSAFITSSANEGVVFINS